MVTRTLRVGNGAGFWGDHVDAPVTLARAGRLDVLTLEYLAELTLAILAHQRSRDPAAGFVTDFPEVLAELGTSLREQDRLRIVTNAGGLNPRSCAARCAEVLSAAGLEDEPMAVVEGDDLLNRFPAWHRDGTPLDHLETGQPIDSVLDRLVCANVYLGARPIVEAMRGGARVVITGRVADASLTLGPACHAFGWSLNDWDRLAGASVAGHVIECGAQATGGLWHRWDEINDLAGIGYPIAEVRDDGASVITKPEGSGGLVSVATVSEQLVYEIDDPSRYRTPDVDVDLTSVQLESAGPDRVLIQGCRGQAPSDRLKVAAVYRDGWTASGMLAVVGRGAEAKARAAGRLILDRLRRSGHEPAESLVECLGAGGVVPGVLRNADPIVEVVLRVTARDPDRSKIARFCREFAPLVTSGPPGIAGYATGRPSPRPAFAYWPTLISAATATEQVRVEVRRARDWMADQSQASGCD